MEMFINTSATTKSDSDNMAKKEVVQEQKIVIKAEELAKKQRDISISEFFTKNRHLLGFDNPTRALLMTIKEACDNSLTYDMPLITKQKGKFSIIKIGELIDAEVTINKGKINRMRGGDLERLQLDNNLEVLAFDKKSLKLSFHNVSVLFRHKVNSPIYRITLTSGRYVDLTAYHSIFTLDKGKIVSIPTTELDIGMPIIVPRNSWASDIDLKEINLIEELILLDEKLTSRINVYGVNSILTDEIIAQIKMLLPKSKKYRINDFRKLNYLPLSILRQLHIDFYKLGGCKIGTSLCRYKIPAIIKLDYNFAELMGLYTSEGSVLKSLRRLHFSFGSHEKELVIYTVDLFEKVFGLSPKIKKAHSTAYNVISNCTILCFILKHIFKVGDYANTKKIPEIIFSLNKSLKYSFLLAYLTGDGYPSKALFYALKNDLVLSDINIEKITCATASFELYTGLQYLLSSLGMIYSAAETNPQQRIVKDVKATFGKDYYIYIYTSGKKSPINLLPKDVIINTSDSKISGAITRENQSNISFNVLSKALLSKTCTVNSDVNKILEGDLGVLRVKSIEKIDYKHEWVYDLAVPNCENFVAGVGAILCHNSLDACNEMNVLPEVLVEIKKINDERFRIIVEDNGPGIVKENIPKAFGKLLYGSKFHTLRQSRGQQGIGISASVLYSQLTTGKHTVIISKINPKKPAHYYELKIDTAKNEPLIIKDEVREWNKEHGTRIEIELEAKYQKGKQSVDEYIKETAIVNPQAKIVYITPENEKIEYPRVTNELPIQPREIKFHPHGIELGKLMTMLQDTKARNISSFLQTEFSRIGAQTAKEMCAVALLSADRKPESLNHEEIERLFKAMQSAKVIAPSSDCLSPIGAALLEKGLKKEITADFYVATSRPPSVYRGFPFVIEVAIAYGGSLEKEGQARIMRFANRVPLLYQQGACGITEAITDTNWKPYGLQQSGSNLPVGPAVIIVHMASVWVPFTSEAKDAVAHYPDIIKEMKLALQECGRKLSSFIRRTVRVQEAKERIDLFNAYIPELAHALGVLTGAKKDALVTHLNKTLKKGLADIMAQANGESNGAKKEE